MARLEEVKLFSGSNSRYLAESIADYYQQPLPLMNFNVSQTFGNGFAVKASANNLLNGKYRETAEYKGEEYSIIQYELGRTFSLGLSYNLSK